MFCENCGKQLEDDAKVCSDCGVKVDYMQDINAKVSVSNITGENNNFTNLNVRTNIKVKEPMKYTTKVAIVEIFILAIMIYISNMTIKSINNPQNVAENYFEALVEGDLGTAFELLDLPESEFYTKEAYAKSIDTSMFEDLANYIVSEEKNDEYYFSEYFNLDSEEEKVDDAIVKTYVMDYIKKGSSTKNTIKVELVKQKEKKWLFFDEWKVMPSDSLVEEYNIFVPQNATVSFAGVMLDDKYIAETENTDLICYKLEGLFSGKYEIKVKLPYMLEEQEQVDIMQNDSIYIEDFEIVPSVITELGEKSSAFYNLFYENALAKNEFNKLDTKLFYQDDVEENVSYAYNNLLAAFSREVDDVLNLIKFSNFTAQLDDYGFLDGKLVVSIYLKCDYNYTYQNANYNWWTSEKIYEEIDDDGSTSALFTYVLENDEWKLYDTNIGSVIYLN